jgi:3-demethylubiquinone-9 3-methyltransferase
MNVYVSLVDRSPVLTIERYGAGQEGGQRSVKHAPLSLNDQRFVCFDSNLQHDWTFVPAVALYVGSGPPGWSPAPDARPRGGLVSMDRLSFYRRTRRSRFDWWRER